MDLTLTSDNLVLLVLGDLGLSLVNSTLIRLVLLSPFSLYISKWDLSLTPPCLPLQFNLSLLILLMDPVSIHLYVL